MRKLCIIAALLLAAPNPALAGEAKEVVASYYSHGHTTANGERYNPDGKTAAHRTLPFGTKVKVTNPVNNKSVVVRINDRGPFIKSRSIDLSRGAAVALGIIGAGVAKVIIEILDEPLRFE